MRHWKAKTLLGLLAAEFFKLLSPAGAVFAALEKTYTTIVFFIKKAHRIQAVLSTLVESLWPIALGQTGPAAAKVEAVLAGLVPLALAFVADFIGLGGLTGAVRGQLERVRGLVDKLVERLLDKVMKLAARLVSQGQQVAGQVTGAVKGWLGMHREFKTDNGEEHKLFFKNVNGQLQLMRASDFPTEISEFLNKLEKADTDAAKKEKIWDAKSKVSSIKSVMGGRTTLPRSAIPLQAANPHDSFQNSTQQEEDKVGDLLMQLALQLHTLYEHNAALLPVYDAANKVNPSLTYGDSRYKGTNQFAKAVYLNQESATGGSAAVGDTPEMTFVKGRSPKWVKMHMITSVLGGTGESQNWVPAPTDDNNGPAVKSFEVAAEKLVRTKKVPTNVARYRPPTNPKYPVLWMDVRVEAYHPPHPDYDNLTGFVSSMTFVFGTYLPPLPDEKNPVWHKVDQPIMRQLLHIRAPNDGKTYLNSGTRTQMQNTSVIYNATADQSASDILLNRKYSSVLRDMLVKGKGTYVGLRARDKGRNYPMSVESQMQERISRSTHPDLKGNVPAQERALADLIAYLDSAPDHFGLDIGL